MPKAAPLSPPLSEAPGAVLISRPEIDKRVGELAREIRARYLDLDSPLILLCILKGSMFFLSDLARQLDLPLEIECIAVRSYEGKESTGMVELVKDVSMPLRNRHVLMVEDIVDTGETIRFLQEHIGQHNPSSVRLVTLLSKSSRRVRDVSVDFVGFDIPNRFVIGYGLDLDGLYRNLPEIRALD